MRHAGPGPERAADGAALGGLGSGSAVALAPQLVDLLVPGGRLSGQWGDRRSAAATSLVALSQTLQWLCGIVSEPPGCFGESKATSEPLSAAWSCVAPLLQEAAERVAELRGLCEAAFSAEEQRLQDVIDNWVRRLRALDHGACALFPVAWPVRQSSDRGGGGTHLHVGILVVQRTSADSGCLAMVNPLGSGSEYHPQRLNGRPTWPQLCGLPVRVGPIAWPRLCTSSFWSLLLRPIFRDLEDADPWPAQLYEVLLPFLTRQKRSVQLYTQLQGDNCDADWSRLPPGDPTKVHLAMQALVSAFQCGGDGETTGPAGGCVGPWLQLLIKWEGVRQALERGPPLAPLAVREASCALAREASELGSGGEGKLQGAVPCVWQAGLLDALHVWLEARLSEAAAAVSEAQVLPDAPLTWRSDISTCSHVGFERLAEAVDVSALAGSPERPDVPLPVPLVLVPRVVADYHEAAVAVQHCVRACALLANQREMVDHADFHAVALVQRLFAGVLPVPLRRSQQRGCFWRARRMDRETQMALVGDLGHLIRHFIVASLALPQTAHLHSVRLLTLAAALAVMDAVLRRVPGDSALDLSRVYSGTLRTDVTCSGFGLAQFPLAEEMKELCLADPVLAQLRTNVLDYLCSAAGCGDDAGASSGKSQADSRSVFGFADMRLGKGDLEFLHRLALLRGFARGGHADRGRLTAFLAGQVPEFLLALPGLTALRDAAFLLRCFCTPLANLGLERRRSDGSAWRPSDAHIRWEVGEDGRLRAFGFQRVLVLDQQGGAPIADEELADGFSFLNLGKKFTAAFLGGSSKTQSIQSAAQPSNLAGVVIKCEDDVLHAADLPTFGGRISPGESEQLLAALTAPYLRVPLVLQFFNDRARFGALIVPQLQAMVDAVLFEPGPFLEEGAVPPSSVGDVAPLPLLWDETCAAGDAAFATPAGRLVHELVNSPMAVLPELDGIFHLAMERDSPTFHSAAIAVLFAIRLWARVTAYIKAMLRCSEAQVDDVTCGDGHAAVDACTRGFGRAACKPETLQILSARAGTWSSRLRLEAVPTLERWCSRAIDAGDTDVACGLWLHLALVHRWSEPLSTHAVSTLLCAEVFLNANLKYGTALAEDRGQQRLEMLGMSDSEIFELFHATRPRVYSWLKREIGDRNRILEHVVTVVASSQISQDAEEAAVLGRRWLELESTWDGSGRFAPSAPGAADTALAEEDLSQWLTASTHAATVEVNVNVGQLQFRQHLVTSVPEEVLALPEFKEIVLSGSDVDPSSLMWALVEKTPTRARYRFAGLRYEFRLWTPTDRAPACPATRPFPGSATPAEAWVAELLNGEPALRGIWNGWGASSWLAPSEEQNGDVVRLYAATTTSSHRAWREIEVFRRPAFACGGGVAHVYETVECGPRFVRAQVFTTSAAWTYAAIPQQVAQTAASASRAPLLEIVHEDSSGESVLVPRRFLVGLLPECLLETFEFWRARPGRLVGKMQIPARRKAPVPTALIVHMGDGATVHLQRIQLDATNRTEEAKQVDRLLHLETESVSIDGETLVDVLRASPGSGAWEVACWALQLDDLSHVLVWVSGNVVGGRLKQDEGRPRIVAVEFPRLGLSFTGDESDDCRLRCDQHGGLRVVAGADRISDEPLRRLLRAFPRFVLLEDDAGDELFALVSIADRPQYPKARGSAAVLVRSDPEWLAALRQDHRHHLFSVHASYEFLTAPTLVAELHLMLLRVLSGMYREACVSVLECTGSGMTFEFEENLIWQEIVQALRDDPCLDAIVLRLKLMLALHRHGQGAPDGWDLESDLIAWSLRGHDSSVGILLTPTEDKALLDLIGPTSWQLKARDDVHTKILCLYAPRGHCALNKGPQLGTVVTLPRTPPNQRGNPLPGPNARGMMMIDDVKDRGMILADPNNTDHLRYYVEFFPREEHPPVDVPPTDAAGSPDAPVVKPSAMSLFMRKVPPRLPRDFRQLYELVTGNSTALLGFGDDAAIVGELLIRLVPPADLKANPTLAGVLRALQDHPEVACKMPGYKDDTETFVHGMIRGLSEHRDALQHLHKEGTAGTLAPATWAFERWVSGTWVPHSGERGEIVEADDCQQTSTTAEAEGDLRVQDASAAADELTERGDTRRMSFYLESPAHGDGEAVQDLARIAAKDVTEGPLTSPRLLGLAAVLQSVGDRRLPSHVWDFDCEVRQLGEVPELSCEAAEGQAASSVEGGSFASDEDDEEFGSPRSAATANSMSSGLVDIDAFLTYPAQEEPGKLGDVIKDLGKRLPKLFASDLPALISRPLKSLGLHRYVTWNVGTNGLSDGPPPVLGTLEPEHCAIGQTVAGRTLLWRLLEDAEYYARPSSEPCLLQLTKAGISDLIVDQGKIEQKVKEIGRVMDALSSMLEKDRRAVLEAVRITVEIVNGWVEGRGLVSGGNTGDAQLARRLQQKAHRLGQLGGSVMQLSFQDIMHLLLVRGGVDTLLPHLNPHLSAQSIGDAATACAVAMLLSTRTIICRRSIVQLRRLSQLLAQARSSTIHRGRSGRRSWWSRMNIFGKEDSESAARSHLAELGCAIAEAAEQAARELTTEQHCVMQRTDFDPRLLCFEFVSRIVLRKKQVELVRSMRESVERGEPLVHQMLMGQGKTTVVTPLVALLLGRADRLCVVCTPVALLEFTVRVLRQRLAAALARPVLTFNFTRSMSVSDEFYLHLLHMRDARAVLCSGPTALKSMMLRFLLTIHDIDVLRSQELERREARKNQKADFLGSFLRFTAWPGSGGSVTVQTEDRLKELRCEAQVLGWTAKIFKGGLLLLDDIDLLMHPLRSELHWPLGEQHRLDFTAPLGIQGGALGGASSGSGAGASGTAMNASYVASSPDGSRWQVAFHLLDGLYSCQLQDGPAVASFEDAGQSEATDVLRRLREAVAKGLRKKHLQAAPHLALLSDEFYHRELRPVLAEWLMLWIRRRTPVAAPDAQVLEYLCGLRQPRNNSELTNGLQDLGDHQTKALSLSRTWLAVLLPHIFSRIHRVHYGLLDEKEASWPSEPRARRNLAVPFVGKDAPSDNSQFSHPDVVIGLTWLAHRLGGLRDCDFSQALGCLLALQHAEADMAPRLRQARRLYCAWVSAAGAHVRGDAESARPAAQQPVAALHVNDGQLALQGSGGDRHSGVGIFVPPLEWLEVRDTAQVATIYRVLGTSPFLIEFYLHKAIFPELLRHADAKLSASGQDLGGEVLCGSRLGFSGTPNDLLPRALGRCAYAQGDDAKMLHTLTDPAVVEVWPIGDGWSAHSLLQQIAQARPPPNALIDVGALITGLSNEEVAQALLDLDLPFEAVIFCDQGGGQCLLTRGRPEPVKLAHCTLPPERCFVFYDQVHTTGIDIRHSSNARAALTLGKDSTFRDFAQGAYRMRGIGQGQRLWVLLTPEVEARVRFEVPTEAFAAPPSLEDGDETGPAQGTEPGPDAEKAVPVNATILNLVCAWLLVRQASTEHLQRHLLRRQAVAHEGRRCAYTFLQEQAHHLEDDAPGSPDTGSGSNEQALDLFRERVDYTVESSLCPSGGGDSVLKAMVSRIEPFLDVEGSAAVKELVQAKRMVDTSPTVAKPFTTASPESAGTEDPLAILADQEQAMCAEEEQEYEQELFAEQEQEKEEEDEQEEEEERETEMSPDAAQPGAAWQILRRDEQQEPWPLARLARPPDDDCPFYAASAFELPTNGGRQEVSVRFPHGLLVSKNFHRPGKGRVARRLRAPVAILEWLPEADGDRSHAAVSSSALATASPALASHGGFTAELLQRLQLVLDILGLNGTEHMSMDDTRSLLAALAIDAGREEVSRATHMLEAARMESMAPAQHHGGSLPLDEGCSTITPEVVAEGLRRAHALESEPGRYYVLLTLAEAEAVRVALHLRADRDEALLPQLSPHSSVALRLLTRDPLSLRTVDVSKGWREAPFKWQERVASELLLFLQSELQYSAEELESLWRLLRRPTWQGVPPTSRENLREFFLASYSLRRRPQPCPWQEMPVQHLFKTEREYEREQREAALKEAHGRMLELGWLPAKAFALLDTNKDAKIQPRDFSARRVPTEAAAMDVLGFPPRLLPRLFRALDQDGSGAVSEEAWRVAFEGRDEGDAVTAVSTGPIRPPGNVPLGVLRGIVIERANHARYTQVWNSEGTNCRKHMSIWAADHLVSGFMRVTALKLSIGHYANQGFSDARGGLCNGVASRHILQVRYKRFRGFSSQEQYLTAVADHYCPCPTKFKQVWCQLRGKPLFIWRPVPPSDAFVALGMVATTTAEPPPVERVRCVAKSFCRPALKAPVHIWDDSGMGGKPASVWAVNASQVLCVVLGHSAPQETFWELASDSVSFDYTGLPSVHIVHERGGADGPRRAPGTPLAAAEPAEPELVERRRPKFFGRRASSHV